MKTINVEEMKSVQMAILKHVDSFCKKKDIKYFMCGGSLIGSIRHKGYIPWDDDIDIMMLREDYEKFVRGYSLIEDDPYIVHEHKIDSNYLYPYAKVEDSRTILLEDSNIKNNFGICIDVFPIDKVPDNTRSQQSRLRKIHFLLNLYNLKGVSIRTGRAFWKNTILACSNALLFMVSYRYLIKKIERIALLSDKTTTKFCGILVWGYGFREINKLENFEASIDAKFEDLTVPIPVGYDNYLTSVYGDYMQLPPVEKRVSHHDFLAFWK